MTMVSPSPAPPTIAPPLASLSIVLPCFDEAENVAAAVAEATAAATRFADDYEVIVVDDGSRDGTRAVADALAAADPHVRVIAHDENRGYGAAVRSGFAASSGSWVLLTDGDRQFDLADLRAMAPLAERHDMVAGFRVDRADPPHRRVAARAWNRLVRHSFGIAIRDVDCAFKLMRGDALRALPLESDGAMISTELVVRAGLAGWRVAEVGVQHRPRPAGAPTGGSPRVILRAFGERRALARRLRAEAGGARPWASARPSAL